MDVSIPFWGVAAILVAFAQDVNNDTAAIASAQTTVTPDAVATHHHRAFAPARWVPKTTGACARDEVDTVVEVNVGEVLSHARVPCANAGVSADVDTGGTFVTFVSICFVMIPLVAREVRATVAVVL
jgi:hypothetical protein